MPAHDLKSRVLAAVTSERSPTRREHQIRAACRLASAVALPVALFVGVGGPRIDPRPLALVAMTTLGCLAIAASALFVAVGRGSSMLGRSRRQLLGMAMLVPALLLLWKLAASSTVPSMMEPWPGRPGLRCFALTALLAAWPVAMLLRELSSSDPLHPRALGAALGVAAGAAAAVLVDLWCPVAHAPHVLAGHLAPIVLLAGLGTLIGERALGIRLPG